MFEGFTRGHATIDGTDIAYVIGGSGPPVLLLHGFPQSKAMWARVAPQLALHHTIVCADTAIPRNPGACRIDRIMHSAPWLAIRSG